MTLEVWSEQVGERPHTVTVFERADKGLAVYLRWWVHGKPRHAKTAVGSIRDPRGRILKRKQDEARAEAMAKLEELKGGRPAKRPAGPMSLDEGVERAFSLQGPFPADPAKDRYTRESKARVQEAVVKLGGGDVLYEEVTPGMIRGVWRSIHRDFVRKGQAGGGYNHAEKVLTNFFTVCAWLEGEFPDQRFPRPLRKWRGELRAYWAKQGHAPATARHREERRHSPEELASLYAHRREADPRLQLALKLGGRLRGGQVIRAMRSHFDRNAGIPMRRGRLGKFRIPFVSDRKRAPTLSLNWRERLALEHALRHGYLADLEAAYQRGEIPDYALFPQGKLRKSRATLAHCDRPMEQSTLVDLLRDLEKKADVKQMPHRGWHGLRRGWSDIDERKQASARAKDNAGGWVPGSTMRQGLYQHGESEEVLEETSRLRSEPLPWTQKEGGR